MQKLNVRFRNRLWFAAVLMLVLVAATAAAGGRARQVAHSSGGEAVASQAGDGIAWKSLRMPPVQVVETTLRGQGKLPLNASQDQVSAAVEKWYKQVSKKFYFGPSPEAYRQLLQREKALLDSEGKAFGDDEKLETPPKDLLGVVVEFQPKGGEETINRLYPKDPADPSKGCVSKDFKYGPLTLGQDPPPGPADNFTFFKPGISIADYQSAFFETGPDAGYGVVRPDLGGIDLSGYSLNNYLAEMSHGTYQAGGGFLADPMSLPHAHEFYGYSEFFEDEDGNCVTTEFSDANYGDFAFDTVDAIKTQYGDDPSIDWSQYDADDDHIVDLLVIIHAGYAYQNGGGIDRLSTTSSGFVEPQQITGFDTPDDDSDDYFIQGFNVDPEQLDVGGIQEEFEHQFGLPDIYVVDGNNSNSFWGAHSSGVWGGPLGGARPVGHNLWQDWVLGWRKPQVIRYDDPQLLTGKLQLEIGRARYKPEGTEDGLIVRLPNGVINVKNLAGEGKGWYSQSGDMLDNRVTRQFDLTDAAGTVLFSFDAWWDIEQDYDYGLIEFSTNGDDWITLPDKGGFLTDEDPNDIGIVQPGKAWGLTGQGEGTLTFDITQFKGKKLWIRLRYLTDPGVSNPAWMVDNIKISDKNGTIYESDLENGFDGWTNEGWVQVPYVYDYARYYLMEWRDDNGFDKSLNDPYNIAYLNPNEPPPELTVDRLPATTPGLVIAYRDTSQGFDYSITDSILSGQSIGTKFAHLVVDSHFWPRFWDAPDPDLDNQLPLKLNGRVLPGDAPFTQVPTHPWEARRGYDPETGESVEEKQWDSLPPAVAFHDSYGYYPGLFYSPETDGVYFTDYDASVVLPAKGPYTTRITDAEGNLLTDLFGFSVGGFELGTGNPGDSHVQFGLHVQVDKTTDQRGTISVWNRAYQVWMNTKTDGTLASGKPMTTTFNITENIGGKIEDPRIIIRLPEGVAYQDGSGFGGLGPLDEGTRSSLGLDAESTYLVWAGDDIWTGASVEPFGFKWTANGQKAVTFDVLMYHNGNELFQQEQVSVGAYPNVMFMPVLAR